MKRRNVALVLSFLLMGCGGDDTADLASGYRGVVSGWRDMEGVSWQFSGAFYLLLDAEDGNDRAQLNFYPEDGEKMGMRDGVAVLSGQMNGSSFEVGESGGWRFSGSIDGDSVQGEFEGPPDGSGAAGASGQFAGLEDEDALAITLAGEYSGSDEGVWNFVMAPNGQIAGAFEGVLSGLITGSYEGNEVTLMWSGSSLWVGEVFGTATGALTVDEQAGSAVNGSWSGSDSDGEAYNGSFVTTLSFDDMCPNHVVEMSCGDGMIQIAEYGCVPTFHKNNSDCHLSSGDPAQCPSQCKAVACKPGLLLATECFCTCTHGDLE